MVDSEVHYKDKKFGKDHELGTTINAYDGFIMGAAFVLKVSLSTLYLWILILPLFDACMLVDDSNMKSL